MESKDINACANSASREIPSDITFINSLSKVRVWISLWTAVELKRVQSLRAVSRRNWKEVFDMAEDRAACEEEGEDSWRGARRREGVEERGGGATSAKGSK